MAAWQCKLAVVVDRLLLRSARRIDDANNILQSIPSKLYTPTHPKQTTIHTDHNYPVRGRRSK